MSILALDYKEDTGLEKLPTELAEEARRDSCSFWESSKFRFQQSEIEGLVENKLRSATTALLGLSQMIVDGRFD